MDASIEASVLDLLLRRRAGWQEFDLLRELAGCGHGGFEACPGGSLLDLYRRHFRLFHLLYRLRDELRAGRSWDLSIHCLDIRLVAYRNSSSLLPERLDGLREHYRDLAGLERLTQEDVETLIEEGLNRICAREQRADALSTLGLCDPVEQRAIRRRFHELALVHHPDCGGEVARFQKISAAAASLR